VGKPKAPHKKGDYMKSIVRTSHNKEKPYFLVCHKSVNDTSLDNASLGLWLRCLSNQDDCEFHVPDLAKKCKTSIYQIHKQLRILIQNGYCTRATEYKVGPSKKKVISCVIYTIYEEKQIKKCFLDCENRIVGKQADQECGFQHVGNRNALTSIISSSFQSEDKKTNIISTRPVHNSPPPEEASRVAKAPLSADASEIYDHFLKKIRERKPDFKEPRKESWIAELDRMLRLDKRDKAKVKSIISWLVNDDFWFGNVLCPQKLRSQFDQLEIKMKAFLDEQKKQPNKKLFYKTKAKAPDRFKSIRVTAYGIVNERTGRDAGWDLPEKTFAEIFASMVGANISGT
jgi:hypothetical protein